MKKITVAILLVVLIVGAVSLTACTHDGYKSDFPFDLEYDVATDYGVYWYADGEYVRSSENMDAKYFDASKPTLIFAHGWEPDEENSSNGLVEDFVTHKDTISKTGIASTDYATQFKEQGYNVACLGWFGYASGLNKLFEYIWIGFDNGYALSVRFAQELCCVLGDDYNGSIKLLGHSYGSQVAIATTYQLTKFLEDGVITNKKLIPTRLTLADPYIGATSLISKWSTLKTKSISYTNEPLNGRAPKTLLADTVEYIVDKNDVAVDIYAGMGIASTSYYDYDGTDPDFEKLSENCTFVKSEGLKKKYGDLNIHNITRDWVFLSLVNNVILYDQNGDVAPSGAASDEQIKALRGKCYYQTYEGLDLSKDSMLLKDRSDGTY